MKKGFSLLECIIALSLASILLVTMIPILGIVVKQSQRIEEQRKENEFLENLVTAIEKQVPIEVDGQIYRIDDHTSFQYNDQIYDISWTQNEAISKYVVKRDEVVLFEINVFQEGLHTP